MNKKAKWGLIGSIIILFILLLTSPRPFMPLYYVLWILGVGGYVYRNQEKLIGKISNWTISPFKKFFGLGIGAILTEEVFASTSMHLKEYIVTGSFNGYFFHVFQFWALNIFALMGIIVAWYILLKHYNYARQEIFIIGGLFGLFSEKVYIHLFTFPIVAVFLIIPTVFTYGVIISIPALSVRLGEKKEISVFQRWVYGLFLPFLCSIPFIGILLFLEKLFPWVFPGAGLVM